jgi:hypothetical protein
MLINKQKYADFAAPLPNQSGASWLWNRVANDTGIVAQGLANAVRGEIPKQGLLKSITNGYKNRQQQLGIMDLKSVSRGKQNQSAMGGFLARPGNSTPPHSTRMFDDPVLETTGRDYWNSRIG